MKALLCKDWRVARKQIVLPLSALWMLGMGVMFGRDARAGMGVGYGVAMVCGLLPFLTIGYDEASQSNRFSFSQPVDRDDYVWSKYLPNLVLLALFSLYLLIAQAVSPATGAPLFFLLSILPPVLVTAALLPLVFALGTNRTRFVYMGLIFAMVYAFGAAKKWAPALQDLALRLAAMLAGWAWAGAFAVPILLLGGSIFLSLRIVRRKDF